MNKSIALNMRIRPEVREGLDVIVSYYKSRGEPMNLTRAVEKLICRECQRIDSLDAKRELKEAG